MDNKLIIGVSGKKQSGKNTMCDCLYDLFLKKYSTDNILILSFADALKQKVCRDVLGLTEEQINGTDDQKNSLTIYKWENLPRDIRYHNKIGYARASNGEISQIIYPEGYMTSREIMQIVGTDVFRKYFDDNVWVNATLREIRNSDARVFLISDVRFPSEVMALVNEGAIVIRLLRDVCDVDTHSSETALDDFDFHIENCILFDNKDMDVNKQNKETIQILANLEKID